MSEAIVFSLDPQLPFFKGPATVQIQSVLYHNELERIERSVCSLARSAELVLAAGVCAGVTLRYGDSSPKPCLDPAMLARLNDLYGKFVTIEYDPFPSNLGSARGHNRLAEKATADFLLIQNPDIIESPRLLEILLETFRQPGTGMAEAKQLPVEHPKDYDFTTGETCWATTACALIPTALFHAVGGFDAESFFLYCDDVDFSWMVRQAGFKVIFQPAALVFHDKRLTVKGEWINTPSEVYYSAEAALFLTHKWSRSDLTEKYLEFFCKSTDENLLKAASVFMKRRDANQLSQPRDAEHKIAQFIELNYAQHRYAL